MARFVRGDVVVLPFPFSGGSGSKRRPAVVLGSWPYESSTDYLVCLITSKAANDPLAVALDITDIEGGSLHKNSCVRPLYLFAADEGLIEYKIGTLTASALDLTISRIVGLLQPSIDHE